jgi:hypothetical protein
MLPGFILSTDRMVWPSVAGGSANQWICMNAPFWDDLNALRNAIPKDFPFWLMAATWHTHRSFEEDARTAGKFLGPQPRAYKLAEPRQSLAISRL